MIHTGPMQYWSLTVILSTAAATRCCAEPHPMDVTEYTQQFHLQFVILILNGDRHNAACKVLKWCVKLKSSDI